MSKVTGKQFVLLFIVTILIIGCGGSKVEVESVVAMQEEEVSISSSRNDNVQIEGLLGQIEHTEVESVFQDNQNGILKCYSEDALEILEEIEGNLVVFLIVKKDGKVKEAYFKEGNFGSDDAQECMLKKIRNYEFHPPRGGDTAEVTYSFPLEAPYDYDKPFDWSGDKVQQIIADNSDDVATCLNGKTGITLTIYIGPQGRVLSAGAAADGMDHYEAGKCLALKAMSWKFDDPGKTRPAKAAITF